MTCENIHGVVGEFQRDYLYKLFLDYALLPQALLSRFAGIDLSLIDIVNRKAVFPDRETKAEKVQWGDDYFWVPVNNAYERSSDFEFFDDEKNLVYEAFNFLKDFTGNEITHAPMTKPFKFNMGVALISVDKKHITRYRRLIGCSVYKVAYGDTKKDGSNIRSINVTIKWDSAREDRAMRFLEV